MFVITDEGNPRACHVYEKVGFKNEIPDEVCYVYEFDKIPPLSLKDTVEQLKNIVPEKVYKTISKYLNNKEKEKEKWST